MKTKLLCVILSLLLISSIFAACSNATQADSGESVSQLSEKPSADSAESGVQTSDDSPATASHGEETVSSKRPLEERFADCTCEVLSKTVVPITDTSLSDSGEENATILTLFVAFPDWDTQYDCGSVRVLNPAGEAPLQSCEGWKNDMETYFAGEEQKEVVVNTFANVYLVAVPGDVETDGLSLKLKESFGKTEVNIPINDSSRTLADVVLEAFPISVVILQGRAYIYTNREAWGTSGDNIYRSLNLMPLEGGYAKTLDKSNITLKAPTSDAYKVQLYVNEFNEHDHRKNNNESEFTVEVKDEHKDAGVDFDAVFKEISIEVDDGTGNITTLRFH